jgi:hypothetical protein
MLGCRRSIALQRPAPAPPLLRKTARSDPPRQIFELRSSIPQPMCIEAVHRRWIPQTSHPPEVETCSAQPPRLPRFRSRSPCPLSGASKSWPSEKSFVYSGPAPGFLSRTARCSRAHHERPWAESRWCSLAYGARNEHPRRRARRRLELDQMHRTEPLLPNHVQPASSVAS